MVLCNSYSLRGSCRRIYRSDKTRHEATVTVFSPVYNRALNLAILNSTLDVDLMVEAVFSDSVNHPHAHAAH